MKQNLFETSTRLKSRDSRTPRRESTWRGPELHYSRRTPAGIAPGRQTADLPGMVCPLVLHDSLPFYGLSFRGVTGQRPVSCTCNRRSGFCPLCRINMFSGKRWFTGYSGRTCRLSESKACRTWLSGDLHLHDQFRLHPYKLSEQLQAFFPVRFFRGAHVGLEESRAVEGSTK